jgi:hypothetical protein
MPESNTDFTYLSILRELEKEVAQLAGKDPTDPGASLTRTNAWFKGPVGGLLSFATSKIAGGSKVIAKSLGVTSQAIKTLAGPELFRVTSLRGRTRWRYGINTLKATRLFLAAAKFGEIARREPSHVAG